MTTVVDVPTAFLDFSRQQLIAKLLRAQDRGFYRELDKTGRAG